MSVYVVYVYLLLRCLKPSGWKGDVSGTCRVLVNIRQCKSKDYTRLWPFMSYFVGYFNGVIHSINGVSSVFVTSKLGHKLGHKCNGIFTMYQLLIPFHPTLDDHWWSASAERSWRLSSITLMDWSAQNCSVQNPWKNHKVYVETPGNDHWIARYDRIIPSCLVWRGNTNTFMFESL